MRRREGGSGGEGGREDLQFAKLGDVSRQNLVARAQACVSCYHRKILAGNGEARAVWRLVHGMKMSAGVGTHMQMTRWSLCSSLYFSPSSKHSPAVKIVGREAALIRCLGDAVVDAAVVVAGRYRHALAQTRCALGRPNGGSRRRLLRPRIECKA